MAKLKFSQAIEAKEIISGAVDQLDAQLSMISKKEQQHILVSEDVVGVGVGLLDPEDESKGAAVLVYTKKNIPKESIESLLKGFSLTINKQKVNVPVRVEVAGEFFANVNMDRTTETISDINIDRESKQVYYDGEYRKRVRPIPAGYSVGTPGASGTIGLIVINDPGNTQLYIMSNNHVLNHDNSSSYTITIQPGGADGGNSGDDEVGRGDRYIRLSNTKINHMDAATSLPSSNSILDPRYGRIRRTLPGHYRQYRIGWRLYKAGRTTGNTTGVVDSVRTDVRIAYGSYGGLGTIKFKDQTIIKNPRTPVSLPGDSGSVWLRLGDSYACACNYAGPDDGRYSISFPVEWFMQSFDCLVAAPSELSVVLNPEKDDADAFSPDVTEELVEMLKHDIAFYQ